MKASQITAGFDRECHRAEIRAVERLDRIGISLGRDVQEGPDKKWYQLTQIHLDQSWGRYHISLYGRLYRKDGSLGLHVHYISQPEDIIAIR